MSEGKRRFWRNFRSLAGANLVAFIILLGLAPILGWIYPPEAFGYLAYFMFAFQVLTSISVYRFDWLIPNARSATEELGMFVWGLISLVIVSALALILFFFPPPVLRNWEGYSAVGWLMGLVPLAMFGMGLRLLLTARVVRTGELRPVSRVKITETLGNAGASIGLGLAGLMVSGLVWARVVASWVGVVQLWRHEPVTRDQVHRLSGSRLRHVFRRHWWSATRSTVVSFTNTLSTNAPILVLGSVTGTAQLGLYLMATRLISTPIQLGAKALSQSFWARSAELARVKDFEAMRSEYLSLVMRLFAVAVGFAVCLLAVGLFIERLFPPEWVGLSATFMAFAPMVLGIVTVGSTNHLIVLDKPQIQLVADVTRLVLMILSVTLVSQAGMPFWTMVLAVSLSSLAGHAVLFAMHLYAYRVVINRKAARP